MFIASTQYTIGRPIYCSELDLHACRWIPVRIAIDSLVDKHVLILILNTLWSAYLNLSDGVTYIQLFFLL